MLQAYQFRRIHHVFVNENNSFFLQKNTDRELTQQAVELFIRKSAKYYIISGHD